MAEAINGGSVQEWRPTPDPSRLTTEQLIRELDSLHQLIEARISGRQATVETRFEAMDKAIELIQKMADRVPSEVDLKVGALERLHSEKFGGIQTQFAERDDRIKDTATQNKLAIDAALQAAKEAVGKTEVAFTKQIDQLGELLQTQSKALDEKISDVKTRQDRLEGRTNGSSSSWGVMAAIVGFVLTMATVAVAVIALATS